MEKPLYFEQTARCNATRARLGKLRLKATSDFGNLVKYFCQTVAKVNAFLPLLGRDVTIETPIFMPVGTSGAMKAVMPLELEETGCQLMLSNTYHLGCQPGSKVVEAAGGKIDFYSEI